MQTFVVLLRGINVGGHNLISMKDLRRSFSEWGYGDVITYIQSGNVIARSSRGANSDTEAELEDFLKERFDYEAKVLTRSLADLERLVNDVPREWEPADPEMRFNVIFLDRSISPAKVLETVSLKKDIETVKASGNALLWCAAAVDSSRTAMAKIPKHALYKSMTIRNLRTTLKLTEIMRDF